MHVCHHVSVLKALPCCIDRFFIKLIHVQHIDQSVLNVLGGTWDPIDKEFATSCMHSILYGTHQVYQESKSLHAQCIDCCPHVRQECAQQSQSPLFGTGVNKQVKLVFCA